MRTVYGALDFRIYTDTVQALVSFVLTAEAFL